MELIIFDKDINFIGILEKQFSYRKVRRYNKCGEFEIHTSFDTSLLEQLKLGNIIYKRGDLEAGYIDYRNISLNEQGQETLIIKGKLLSGYLGKRIINGIININDTIEDGVRSLVESQAITPIDLDRKIPYLALGALKGYTEPLELQSVYKNLLMEIEDVTMAYELGFRTLLDIENKQLIFDLYKGVDKSSEVVFARAFENVLSQEYTDSDTSYKNVAVVQGLDEVIVVGGGVELDRQEIYVDAQKTKKDDLTPIEYTAVLQELGEVELSKAVKINTFDSKINLKSNYTYKVDFDLGDIVTVRNTDWGVMVNTRITEIEEVYEASGFELYVTFGNVIPDLIDKIRMVV